MQKFEEQELLQKFAYDSWLQRGCPIGTPEIDWDCAQRLLAVHRVQTVEVLNLALTRIQAEQSMSSNGSAESGPTVRKRIRRKVGGAAEQSTRTRKTTLPRSSTDKAS